LLTARHTLCGIEVRAESMPRSCLGLARSNASGVVFKPNAPEKAGVGHNFAETYARQVDTITADDVMWMARHNLMSLAVVSLGPPW
jgi:hypothetical protein